MNKHQHTRDRLIALRETQPLSTWQRAELARAVRALNGTSRVAAAHWLSAEVDYLCDMIADGHSFSACATALQRGKKACVEQFKKVRANIGWQAE
jgi:predicted deacylase